MVPEIWSATEIFLILGHFCPFIHLAIWKIKILIKWKMPGDMIILHICTINENHMMCASWCRECEKIFSYFGPFFALLPPNNPQNQNFEKIKKKHLEISSFYTNAPKTLVMWVQASAYEACNRTRTPLHTPKTLEMC